MDKEQKQVNEGNEPKNKGKTVLIVEDEALLGNLLEKKLKKEGFEILRASDGSEAIEIIENQDPDLTLLDIILPKVSGFEFMKKVQESPRVDEIPIVIVSNLGQKSDIEKGKNLGAVGYFVKAKMSIDDLVSQVRDFLNKNK